MSEGEYDDILIVKPCEGEWFVLPVDRSSMVAGIVALYRDDWDEQAILAKLAPLTDAHIRAIAHEASCIEYNKLRWGYDVRYVLPN